MDGRVKRILVESTCSLDTNFTTGIQRVVRSVIAEAESVSRQMGIECVPVVFRKGRFYDARKAWQRRIRRQNRQGQSTLHCFARELDRFAPRAAQFYCSARVRVRKLFYPKTLLRTLNDARWQLGAEPVVPGGTDVLLLLDETWRLPIWPAVEQAGANGCRVGAVVYDLIPIDHPQFFESEFVRLFAERTETLLEHSDFLLPISETVAGRLKAHMRAVLPQPQTSQKLVTSFRLGAASTDVPAAGSVCRRVQSLFNPDSENPPYLCVGTLEPRKNHEYLLNAFETVWKRTSQVKLCIAGRVGWKCQAILERIRRDPRFGKSLFLFTDLNDAELFACYRQARALVSCSVDEGFGLPIVEGLRHGIRVMASDIPVHREIGRESCDYFDLADPTSLAGQVLAMEGPGNSVWKRTPERFTTWREGCEDLLTKTLAMAEGAKAEPTQVMQETDSTRARNCMMTA